MMLLLNIDYLMSLLHISNHVSCLVMLLSSLRGCSYGGELVRLGRLAHLGDISPSLRNSYKI